MSLFSDTHRETYRAQRVASHGSDITLVCGAGKYYASDACATKVSTILGTRNLEDHGESKQFNIPTEEMHTALLKLSERFSVALVDMVSLKGSSRGFAMVWKVERVKQPEVTKTETSELDEY